MSAPVTTATLKSLLAAFNAHDLDVIMGYFAEDCVLLMPRGPDLRAVASPGRAPCGGTCQPLRRSADVHYGDDHHWVAGNLGVSTWLLTGTTNAGEQIACAVSTCLSSETAK